MNYLSIPFYFFIGAVLAEFSFSRSLKIHTYPWKETLSNISHGLLQLVFNIILKGPLLFVYGFCYEHFSLFNLSSSFFEIVTLLFLIDFIYYWFHRLSHENSFFWANHIIHHQPKTFNFSVGLRPPLFNEIFSFFIHLPAAFLGFSPETYVIVFISHTSYQLINHTNFFKKPFPFFKWIFVTPSHHRVHHGQNDHYINKNFGALFSFWDVLFKTYQCEDEKVIYGVKNDVCEDLNPVTSNLNPIFRHFGLKMNFKAPHWLDSFYSQFPGPKFWAIGLSIFSLVLTLGFFKIYGNLAGPIKYLIVGYLILLNCLLGTALNQSASLKIR